MFGLVFDITITQVSTAQYPGRTKVFKFNFLSSGDGNSTWAHLTDTFRLVIPRRIYFKDESTGKVTTWDKEPIYGNPDKQPLLLRGDKISVAWGYSYFKPSLDGGFDRNNIVTQATNRFNGYITKIKNKTPFEIECRDNMYILQQTKVSNKEWKIDGTTYTLETALKEMLASSDQPDAKNFTIKTDNIQHNIGTRSWSNFTMAQVLEDLRTHDRLQSFFRGNELRCGVLRYYPEDRRIYKFHFQKNVIDDDLDYQRADDVRIGIIAKSVYDITLANNSKGGKKTKHKELKVTVGDTDGELKTVFFFNVTTEAELKAKAEKILPYVKYEGFRGSFTTFALPTVKHGDIVELQDDVLTERNGKYLVKAVDPICNPDEGIKQRITLDIRVDTLTPEKLTEFQNSGI